MRHSKKEASTELKLIVFILFILIGYRVNAATQPVDCKLQKHYNELHRLQDAFKGLGTQQDWQHKQPSDFKNYDKNEHPKTDPNLRLALH